MRVRLCELLVIAAAVFLRVYDSEHSFVLFVPLLHTFDKTGKVYYTTIRRELARGQREAASKKREKEARKQWRRDHPDLVWKEEEEKAKNALLGFCILGAIIFLAHFPAIGFSLLGCSLLVFIVYHLYKKKRKGADVDKGQ